MVNTSSVHLCVYEGLLTEKECWDALKCMNLNKSPGCDGLNVELYKCFWNEIKDFVVGSLNEGFNKGELSVSQKQAILNLIYKKGSKTYLIIGDLYHCLTSTTKLPPVC